MTVASGQRPQLDLRRVPPRLGRRRCRTPTGRRCRRPSLRDRSARRVQARRRTPWPPRARTRAHGALGRRRWRTGVPPPSQGPARTRAWRSRSRRRDRWRRRHTLPRPPRARAATGACRPDRTERGAQAVPGGGRASNPRSCRETRRNQPLPWSVPSRCSVAVTRPPVRRTRGRSRLRRRRPSGRDRRRRRPMRPQHRAPARRARAPDAVDPYLQATSVARAWPESSFSGMNPTPACRRAGAGRRFEPYSTSGRPPAGRPRRRAARPLRNRRCPAAERRVGRSVGEAAPPGRAPTFHPPPRRPPAARPPRAGPAPCGETPHGRRRSGPCATPTKSSHGARSLTSGRAPKRSPRA